MSDKYSLNEYSDKINDEKTEDSYELEIVIKSATFVFDHFLKIKTYLRLRPVTPSLWMQTFPDDNLDLTRISGWSKDFFLGLKLRKIKY